MFGIQERSTHINVRSYWPSVVASATMFLATNALSIERSHGSFVLRVCDDTDFRPEEFAHRHVIAELLLDIAIWYD